MISSPSCYYHLSCCKPCNWYPAKQPDLIPLFVFPPYDVKQIDIYCSSIVSACAPTTEQEQVQNAWNYELWIQKSVAEPEGGA